ncbi:MAG TPA: penicillin-binding protein 2, partial [Acidimicrobiales bacterium]|nr:penicillin-binding protein 2 [Acidimicrobiales bacterium]
MRLRSAVTRVGAKLPGSKQKDRPSLATPKKPQIRTGARLTIVGLIAAALFSTMFVRLWYLQVLDAPHFQKAAIIDQIRSYPIAAPRGLILDRNGNVLVGNTTTEEITLSQSEAKQNPDLVNRLAALLGIAPVQIAQDLANPIYSPLAPVPIANNVSVDTLSYLNEHSQLFPGVQSQQVSERSYPYGDLAAQILGYVGEINQTELNQLKSQGYQTGDQIGQAGLEESYESILRGTPGIEDVAVDSKGNVVQSWIARQPVPGDDIQLSIDANLQQYAESVLASKIQNLRSTYDPYDKQYDPAPDGAVVVEDPNNGQILAMASYPTYNPSVWVGGITSTDWQKLNTAKGNPLVNHAIQVGYTPGSTFKLITSTAALNDGLIGPNTYIDDATGTFTIPHCTGLCTFHDDDSAAQGEVNVEDAITVSDDVFFYTLGYDFFVQSAKYGPNPIQTVAAQYGLGQPSGIDLPGETGGLVDSYSTRQYLHQHYPKGYPNPPAWYPGDQVQMAFGQGATLVSPLQLANAYSILANGGSRFTPKVAAAALNPSTCKPDAAQSKGFKATVAGKVNYAPGTQAALLTGFSGVIQDSNGTAYGDFTGFPLSSL